MPPTQKHITFADALNKARRFCAFQDRCHFEVEEKLKSLGLHWEFIPTVCVSLSQEGYLSEERFVSAYVRGKFNRNKWGRVKIVRGLKAKRISEVLIREGLQEIDEQKYLERIDELARAKSKSLLDKNSREAKQKVYNFLLQKGFEPNLITEAVSALSKEY